jgi:hypothetical protein
MYPQAIAARDSFPFIGFAAARRANLQQHAFFRDGGIKVTAFLLPFR